MGEMRASFILLPCWFVLILFGPIVYGENLGNGALPKLSEAMKRETQRLESFSGRKFGYTHRFSTRKMLVSVMETREKEEKGVLVQRRLLAENTTKHGSLPLQKTETKKAEDTAEKGKNLQIPVASSKGTKEIGQNSTKPEDKSVKQIPVMGTIHIDHSTLGRKDNNTERYEAKIEKLQDGEKINSAQKPLKNRTEHNNNNGSVNTTKDESPLLQNTETKNTEDKTEQGKKLQIQAASSKGPKEISQNSKKPKEGFAKEITVTETIHPDQSNLGRKDSNAERSEAKKENMKNAEKVNSVQNPLNNRTEQNNNHGREYVGGEPAKGTEKITEAKTLPNATEAQTQELHYARKSANSGMENSERKEAETHPISAEIQGIGSGTAANSTGTGAHKIDSAEARNLTDSAKIQTQNTPDEVQKEVNKMEQMENTEIKSLANSSDAELPENAETLTSFADTETQKKQRTEADSSANSTDAENEKTESSEAEALSNSTNDIQQEETLEKPTEIAKSTESETLEDREIKQVESSKDSTDAEAQRTERIEEEFSANSTDTMASTEFKDSVNFTAAEMEWRAQNSRNNKDVEIDGPEDEYNDLIQEFTDLPSKLHDTAEKVADQLMPRIQKFSNKSKIYFSRANEGIAHGFRPLVGHHYAAFVASGISCIFLLLPLLVAIVVFEQIRTFFPLQKVILLANIYMANYFATLVFTSFIIGMEPLEFFYKHSISGYIYLQLLQELGFLLYLSMQCFNVVATCSKRTHLLVKLGSVVQLSVAVCIGLHYYVTVFHRAMAQKPPRTCWRVHVVYSLLYVILCLLSRIRTGKKEYLQAADYNTNKKN